VTVVVNGEPRSLDPGASIAELLENLGLGEKRVAVELNREVVDRGEWARTTLAADDRLEIVQFVGGG
jgi:thiamine biosynthesis protein ThiS